MLNTYVTSNLYRAAYLWWRGYPVEVRPVEGARRVEFHFPQEAETAAQDYVAGATVPAASYADFLARLKAQVVAAHSNKTHHHTTYARCNNVRSSSSSAQQ